MPSKRVQFVAKDHMHKLNKRNGATLLPYGARACDLSLSACDPSPPGSGPAGGTLM
jgi:hypothetical protein